MIEQSQLSLTTVIGPDDVVLIRSIIDEQLRRHGLIPAGSETQELPPKDYTTVHEIRQVISDNLSEIAGSFGANDFHIDTLVHLIRRLIDLKPGDLLRRGHSIRFYHQVGNAIDINNWRNTPIRRSDRRGYYYIHYNR